jgi:hypothetical protein
VLTRIEGFVQAHKMAVMMAFLLLVLAGASWIWWSRRPVDSDA